MHNKITRHYCTQEALRERSAFHTELVGPPTTDIMPTNRSQAVYYSTRPHTEHCVRIRYRESSHTAAGERVLQYLSDLHRKYCERKLDTSMTSYCLANCKTFDF